VGGGEAGWHEWDGKAHWGEEVTKHKKHRWTSSPNSGGDEGTSEEKEKDKYKNLTTFGCGTQKPLPLDKRKDIFIALVDALDPNVVLSQLAVAAWNAEITMGAFWILTQTGPKTPLRWLKEEDGNFSVEHAVKVLKGATLSHFKAECDVTEVLTFISDHAWSNCAEIVHRATLSGYDASEALDTRQSLALAQQTQANCPQGTTQPLRLAVGAAAGSASMQAPKWDSRSGSRQPASERVLQRSDTDKEIDRLKKRKELLALMKDVRGEEQEMAINSSAPATRITDIGKGALPTGLTIATPAVLRGIAGQQPTRDLPPAFYTAQPALLAAVAGSAGGALTEAPERSGEAVQLAQTVEALKRQIAVIKHENAKVATLHDQTTEVSTEPAAHLSREHSEQEAHEQEMPKQQVHMHTQGIQALVAQLQEQVASLSQVKEGAHGTQEEEEVQKACRSQEETQAHQFCEQEAHCSLEQEAHWEEEQAAQCSQEQEAHQAQRQEAQNMASEMGQLAQEKESWAKLWQEQRSEFKRLEQDMLVVQEERAQARACMEEEHRSELAHMQQEMMVSQEDKRWEEEQRSELARMKQEVLVAQEEQAQTRARMAEEQQSELAHMEQEIMATQQDLRRVEEQQSEFARMKQEVLVAREQALNRRRMEEEQRSELACLEQELLLAEGMQQHEQAHTMEQTQEQQESEEEDKDNILGSKRRRCGS
jgi:hypothetical protein